MTLFRKKTTERDRLYLAINREDVQIEAITQCIAAAHRARDTGHVEDLIKRRRQRRDILLRLNRQLRENGFGIECVTCPWEPVSA